MKSILSTLFALAGAVGVAGAAQAGEIYCTGESGTGLAKVDTSSGAGADVGPTGYGGTWAAAFDNDDGTLYTLVNWGEYLGTFDVSTGAVTLIGTSHGGAIMIALEVADDGTIYGLDWSGGLWKIDGTTGNRSLVGYGTAYNAMDLAFDSSGTLWAANGNYLYTIDTATGAATAVGPITGIGGGEVMSITFDQDDVLYAMPWTSNPDLYIVDTGTGAATSVGATGLYFPHGGDILIDLDADGDGVLDKDDHCVHSDLAATVVIDGCDSGVPNALFDDGCTMADLLAECAEDAANHGQYLSCVAALTNSWAKAGLITGKQKGAIQRCAAQSSIGK